MKRQLMDAMKRQLVAALLVLALVPAVAWATSVGAGITPNIGTEDFAPRLWLCDDRVVFDDNTEPGRLEFARTLGKPGDDETLADPLFERLNNYAFEGEQIQWTLLAMDKNGIEKLQDVYVTVGSSQGEGYNDIQVNCQRASPSVVEDLSKPSDDGEGGPAIPKSCNARIDEEELKHFDADTMEYYTCTLTVETPASMYGEYWVTAEAVDYDGLISDVDENEYWFFNPVIALSVEGDVSFSNVRPGTASYSNTLLVGNDADAGSGVMLDMFISGTDFYDSTPSGAACPTTNQLSLSAFRYYATNGAYSTSDDEENDYVDGDREVDHEGYVNIEYGKGWNDPRPFYDNAEILQAGPEIGPYYTANLLTPGSEMPITFKLDLPEPCNGDFDTGSIYFWGEAV